MPAHTPHAWVSTCRCIPFASLTKIWILAEPLPATVGEREPEARGISPPPRPPPTSARIFGAIVLALVVLGAVGYRFWLALGPIGNAPTSDETVVGLMALHLWRYHEVQAFYWHQPYGGTLQTWLMAPFVGVFGAFSDVLYAVLDPRIRLSG